MKSPPPSRIWLVLFSALVSGLGWPLPAEGQDPDPGHREAYFSALAEHFEIPLVEVAILGDWDLHPDEVPVVLYLSSRAGVSADALVGLRRRGLPWRDVASRFGLGVRAFQLALPDDEDRGLLERACREFQEKAPREWDQIVLEDTEIIALVNLRVLSEFAGVPPLQVLRAREEAGSFLSAFAGLLGSFVFG